MDKVRNPFNPGAGSQPPLLVGRDAQIEAMTVAVQRLAIGRFERSMMLKGLHGVGKTVLLNEFGRIAKREGWVHAHLEATEDVRIATAIAALSRRVLLELSVGARAKDRAAHALGVLRSFIKVTSPWAATQDPSLSTSNRGRARPTRASWTVTSAASSLPWAKLLRRRASACS